MAGIAVGGLVGSQELASSGVKDMQILGSDEARNARGCWVASYKVLQAGLGPKFLKLRVVDEDIRCAWGIRSI